ncbi:MAG: hypothetical protein V8S22_07535 [Lachnospiraceae bacterium]
MHFFDPITDFIFIEHEVEAADVIFIPGTGEIALRRRSITRLLPFLSSQTPASDIVISRADTRMEKYRDDIRRQRKR